MRFRWPKHNGHPVTYQAGGKCACPPPSACRNVVTQLTAVHGALDKAGFELISTAMRDCLTEPADVFAAGGMQSGPSGQKRSLEEIRTFFLCAALVLGDLAARHNDLEKSRPVIAVCRSGRRSAAAADQLAAAGFTAYTMSGGMLAWTGAGLPAS